MLYVQAPHNKHNIRQIEISVVMIYSPFLPIGECHGWLPWKGSPRLPLSSDLEGCWALHRAVQVPEGEVANSKYKNCDGGLWSVIGTCSEENLSRCKML